jgi:hypothetical protein
MTASLPTLLAAALLATASFMTGCESTMDKPDAPVAKGDGNPYPADAETPMLWDGARWKQYSAAK